MKFSFIILIFLIQQVASITIHSLLKNKAHHKMHHRHLIKQKLKYSQSVEQENQDPKKLPEKLNNYPVNLQEFLNILKGYSLSWGEIKDVFKTADVNGDEFINQKEWSNFYDLFVKPFEKCDVTSKYELDKGDLKNCVLQPPFNLKGLEAQNNKDDDLGNQILGLSFKEKINLADYLFIRRANLAWQKCADDFTLPLNKLPCAIYACVPGINIFIPSEQELMNTELNLKFGQVAKERVYLYFMEMFELAKYYNFFIQFLKPLDKGVLNKKDFFRAIDEQAFPIDWLPIQSIISFFQDGLNQNIDLKTFCTFMKVNRYLKTYGQKNPGFLTKEEFEKLLKNSANPLYNLIKKQWIVIDNDQNSQKNENDIDLLDQNYQEDDYLIYLQLHTKSKSQEIDYVYNKFDDSHSEKMGMMGLYEFFKLSYLWMLLDAEDNNYITSQKIVKGLQKYNGPILLNELDIIKLGELQDFLGQDRTVDLNQYYAFFQIDKSFSDLQKQIPGLAYEKDLSVGFKRLGFDKYELEPQDQQSQDAIKNPLFNYKQIFLRMLKTQAKISYDHYSQINLEKFQKFLE